MIAGVVNEQAEATIPLRALGPEGVELLITAVIDTGFSDYLTLPPSMIAALGLGSDVPVEATLADGSLAQMDSYQATLLWDGQPREILVLEADGGPLVGMALLYGSRLSIDVVDGGAVTVAPLS